MPEPAWHVAKCLIGPEWEAYMEAMGERYYHRQALAYHITTDVGQDVHRRRYEECARIAKQALRGELQEMRRW